MRHAIDAYEDLTDGLDSPFNNKEYDDEAIIVENKFHEHFENNKPGPDDPLNLKSMVAAPTLFCTKTKFYAKLRKRYRDAVFLEIKSRTDVIKSEEQLKLYISQQHQFALTRFKNFNAQYDLFELLTQQPREKDSILFVNQTINYYILNDLLDIVMFIQANWQPYLSSSSLFNLSEWKESNKFSFSLAFKENQTGTLADIMAKSLDLLNTCMQAVEEHLVTLTDFAAKRVFLLETLKSYEHLLIKPKVTDPKSLDYVVVDPKFSTQMIEFLEVELEHLDRLEKAIPKSDTPQKPPLVTSKIKTAFTVPQLALLFDLCQKENLIIGNQTDIETFVVANFSSKKQADISKDSLHNKISEVSDKDLEDLKTKLAKLMNAINVKQNKNKK
jgi:hypothetical protein